MEHHMRNSQRSLTATLLLLTFSFATVFGQTNHGYDRASLDPNTAACTDFYQYANGGWMAANPIPGAYSSWGVANLLDERNRDMLHEILEAAAKNTKAPKGSSEQKVGDYYATCMDEAKAEADGLKPLAPELDRIAKIKDQKTLQAEIAHLHSMGINVLFPTGSTQDFKNSAEVTAEVDQGGLGLPDRDYYLKTDEKSTHIKDEYIKHVAKMFELMGDDAARAATETQTVLALESACW
jgi:putative endopeptidase